MIENFTKHLPNLLRGVVRLEAAGIAILALWAYGQSGSGWGLFAALILAPDLFMLGYLGGAARGAVCYNLGHSYLTPAILWLMGSAAGSDLTGSVALIWAVHIGIDRALGYGLKYRSGFTQTHLQRV